MFKRWSKKPAPKQSSAKSKVEALTRRMDILCDELSALSSQAQQLNDAYSTLILDADNMIVDAKILNAEVSLLKLQINISALELG